MRLLKLFFVAVLMISAITCFAGVDDEEGRLVSIRSKTFAP